jgi:hypothetical protein
MGHLSRDCPNKGKGKGKGHKGENRPNGGKGPKGPKGKGFQKGFGNPGKSKGKGKFKGSWNPDNGKGGFQGICYNCGKVGHKESECWWNTNVGEVGGHQGFEQPTPGRTTPAESRECNSAEIGRVWNLCQVQKQPEIKTFEMPIRNRFQVLQQSEEQEIEFGMPDGDWETVNRNRPKKNVKFERVPKKKWVRMNRCVDANCTENCQSDIRESCMQDCAHICQVESAQDDGVDLSLKFEVANVRKPLISVHRIVEQGNHVGFGPNRGDNYIENRMNGKKIPMYPNGHGSYVMRVKFPNGEETEITVDSGAEESVCPYEWGEIFGINNSNRTLNLINASGGIIQHYGTRIVHVQSPF